MHAFLVLPTFYLGNRFANGSWKYSIKHSKMVSDHLRLWQRHQFLHQKSENLLLVSPHTRSAHREQWCPLGHSYRSDLQLRLSTNVFSFLESAVFTPSIFKFQSAKTAVLFQLVGTTVGCFSHWAQWLSFPVPFLILPGSHVTCIQLMLTVGIQRV